MCKMLPYGANIVAAGKDEELVPDDQDTNGGPRVLGMLPGMHPLSQHTRDHLQA